MNDNYRLNTIVFDERKKTHITFTPNPERPNRIPIAETYQERNYCYVIKENLIRFKKLSDMLRSFSAKVAFGKSVGIWDFANNIDERRRCSDGVVFLYLAQWNDLNKRKTPLGFDLFRTICNSCDRIAITTNNDSRNNVSIRFYINNIWVQKDEVKQYPDFTLLNPEEAEQLWNQLNKQGNSLSLSDYIDKKKYNLVLQETQKYLDDLEAFSKNLSLSEEDEFPKEIDISILPQIRESMKELNDSLITLCYDCGIGKSISIAEPDDLDANISSHFSSFISFDYSENFDSDKSFSLFKKCLDLCSEFSISIPYEPELQLAFGIANPKLEKR